MISAVQWVPRGAVASHPRYYQPTEEEVEKWCVGYFEKMVQIYENCRKIEADAQLELDKAAGIEFGVDGMPDEDEDSSVSDAEEISAAVAKARKVAKAMKTDSSEDLSEFNLESYDDEPDMEVGVSMLASCNAAFESNFDDPLMTQKEVGCFRDSFHKKLFLSG